MWNTANVVRAAALGLTVATACPAQSTLVPVGEVRALHGSVEYLRYRRDTPLVVDVLRIDLRDARLRFAAVPGMDDLYRRERPSAVAARFEAAGRRVLAAINGDLGGRHASPHSMFVRDGELLVSPSARSVLALSADRRPWIGQVRTRLELVGPDGTRLPVAGLNRHDLPAAGTGLFTAPFGSSPRRDKELCEVVFSASVAPVLRPAGRWDLRVRGVSAGSGGQVLAPGEVLMQIPAGAASPVPAVGEAWTLTATSQPALPWHTVVGGVPRIVHRGRVAVRDEGARRSFVVARHPRTAVGFDAAGETLWWVVVDGRRAGHSVGATLSELAAILVELGAHTALNLDGGGSSTMVLGTEVVNLPSDAEGERATTSTLVLWTPEPAEDDQE